MPLDLALDLAHALDPVAFVQDRLNTNILLSPDFQRLRAELIRVLARYPEAQAEVAAVFRQAELRAATEIGASAENLIEALPVGAEHAA
jgi:hypothetical protein